MRRMYVRGADNVFKRVLVQVAAFNIGFLLRKLRGWGKPRQAQGGRPGYRRFSSLYLRSLTPPARCRAGSDDSTLVCQQ
jgi:hypothetical protein